MIENRDIVMTGLQNFYGEGGSNAVNIARKLAMKNRVLYVNYPLDRSTVLRKRKDPDVSKRLRDIHEKNLPLEQYEENLWVFNPPTIMESTSKIPFAPVFNMLMRVNNKRFARQIRRAMDELDFRDFILFEDGDIYRTLYLKELLQPGLFIYYSRDNITATRFYRHHGKRIESLMIKKADAVLCNSQYLADLALPYNPNSFNVGQGVDLSLFREQEVASDLKTEEMKVVIGYAGALNANRLDIELIRFLAESKPQWHIVLVGPEDELFKKSGLHRLSNVVFTGKKPLEKLPSYIQGFDVAINPQLVNDITIGNYPRKIDEYLAMGKPVVAVETETMKMFSEVVFLAKDYQAFLKGCERALKEKDENVNRRKAVAREHTWEQNIENISRIFNEIEKQKK